MRIGCRAHDYGKMTPEALAGRLRERGYNAAQVAMPRAIEGVEQFLDVNEDMADRIGRAFATQNVQISVLGCYMDLSAPKEEQRFAGIRNIAHCLKLQKLTGAVVVGSETSYDKLSREEKQVRFPLALDSIQRIVEEAARVGGVFAAEPVFWHPFDESLEAAGKILEAVGDTPHFKFILDPVNLIKKKYQGCQSELLQGWLEAFGDRVAAMHIKDFTLKEGDLYAGLPLGEGIADYSYIGRWLKENRPEMPLLREEVILEHDLADIAFMKKLVS